LLLVFRQEAFMGRGAFTLHKGGGRSLPADWRNLLADLPEDLRDAYEERAALIEYDGGEKRRTAERRAFECVVWRNEAAQAFLAAHYGQALAGASA
jgi:hypothetical protein